MAKSKSDETKEEYVADLHTYIIPISKRTPTGLLSFAKITNNDFLQTLVDNFVVWQSIPGEKQLPISFDYLDRSYMIAAYYDATKDVVFNVVYMGQRLPVAQATIEDYVIETHDISEAVFSPDMPNPTDEDLENPVWLKIWEVIKEWDVNVPLYYKGYCGANGSHASMIFNAIKDKQVAPKQRLTAMQDWTKTLPIQMQSTLISAIRGPDNLHASGKILNRFLRGAVLNGGLIGRRIELKDIAGDSYMLGTLNAYHEFKPFETFVKAIEGFQLHYLTHIMDAARIIWYHHDESEIRMAWGGFYVSILKELHVNMETDEIWAARLNDKGQQHWEK